MAFNFFKKQERKTAPFVPKSGDDLDIPPAPISAEDLPEFPELPEMKESKPEMSFAPQKKEPKIPSAEELEEEAYEEEKHVLRKIESRRDVKPVFARLESYKEIINEIGLIKSIIKESEDAVVRVGDFASDQEKEFNRWQSHLSDIQKKLIFIDKTIFKE